MYVPMTETIHVDVAFALPGRQAVVQVSLPVGANIRDAVHASSLQQQFPDYSFDDLKKGVWGAVKEDDHCLQDGDRVEIYRPLVTDPREARRKRAARSRGE
jgi:putative ubiquitin-RnfH superfamily antitoxin RatB of RatAB toxin-antitoxin module